jgi:hypothetical protein
MSPGGGGPGCSSALMASTPPHVTWSSARKSGIPATSGLERYERAWRPVISERQQTARDVAGWFLPASQRRLRARRIALRLAGLPGFDRLLAAVLTGKPVTLG